MGFDEGGGLVELVPGFADAEAGKRTQVLPVSLESGVGGVEALLVDVAAVDVHLREGDRGFGGQGGVA